jgi:outer membrane protein assembly factor BamB
MKRIIILLLLFAVVHPSDWNTFKGSLERTGASDSPAPDTIYLQWKVDLGSELYSSPVVLNERVIQVAFEKVVSINIHTGYIQWISSIPAYNSTPAVSGDKIIVATNRGISAITVENGDPLWEYMVSGRFSKMELVDYIVSTPAISDGKVIVGTLPYSYWHVETFEPYEQNELFLVCLDETTGEEKWYKKTNLGVFSAPCIAYGKVFVTSREVLCIDFESGDILWDSENKYPYRTTRPLEERYAFDYSTPALYHGILIGGSCDMRWSHTEPKYIGWQKIVSIDQYTGDIFWEWIEEGFLASSPAIYKGKIYFYSFDGMVHCLSLLDGKELWKTFISGPQEFEDERFRLWPSPSVADDKVYIGSVEGNFYCLDSCTGEIIWTYEMGPVYSSPAIVSGNVLISSTDGYVYCFGIDPSTYVMKARHYIEEKEYGKAEMFLLKAKECTDKNENGEALEELLKYVNNHKKEKLNL